MLLNNTCKVWEEATRALELFLIVLTAYHQLKASGRDIYPLVEIGLLPKRIPFTRALVPRDL
jgi:hypothetical protein